MNEFISPRRLTEPRYRLQLRAIREMCRENWFSTLAKIELSTRFVSPYKKVKGIMERFRVYKLDVVKLDQLINALSQLFAMKQCVVISASPENHLYQFYQKSGDFL